MKRLKIKDRIDSLLMGNMIPFFFFLLGSIIWMISYAAEGWTPSVTRGAHILIGLVIFMALFSGIYLLITEEDE